MDHSIINRGISRGVFPEKIVNKKFKSDLQVLNNLLESIRVNYNVNILIQSDLSFRRDIVEWQCLIGRKLTDYDCAHTFSNGIGPTIGDAIINSLNEFIDYFHINKDELNQKLLPE